MSAKTLTRVAAILALLLISSAVSDVGVQHSDRFNVGDNVPKDFDCAMRNLALEFALHIQPGLTETQLRLLGDSLMERLKRSAGTLAPCVHQVRSTSLFA